MSLRLSAFMILLAVAGARAENSPVTISENNSDYVLSNGNLTATITKRSGDLVSLKYKGIETIASTGRGYWSHNAAGSNTITTITIDPKSNNGQRAEVSIKGISGGKSMGSGGEEKEAGGSTFAFARHCYRQTLLADQVRDLPRLHDGPAGAVNHEADNAITCWHGLKKGGEPGSVARNDRSLCNDQDGRSFELQSLILERLSGAPRANDSSAQRK